MVCTDRQLTEAQRAEAFDQNRNAGALKAIRPFTGPATPENLVDYLNREVYPVLRQARSAVNEIFRQVTDNAPSGNPLGYFFSASLAGDPAVGRLALDNATQENATTIRVNQQNSILRDITPWLDVMAGSSTAPLGVVTLTAASDPSRYIRWDLDTMTDQGVYWDLGVTVVESSHPNPFVPDGSVVLAFIPGVASTGTTVGPGSITPIADETFLGNVSGGVAPPSAIALSTLAGDGLTWDATNNELDVTVPFVPQGWDDVLLVDATSGANNPIVSAGQFMQLGAVGPSSLSAQLRSGDASFIMHGSSQARIVGGTTVAINAQGGALSATASTQVNLLATTSASVATITSEITVAPATFFRLSTGGSERLEIESTGGWQLGGLVGSAGQYIRSAGAGTPPVWATIALSDLATQAANTIVANATAGVAAPTAVAVAADSVLARVGGNLVSHPWSTLFGTYLSYSAGVADWIGLDVRVNSGALTGTRRRLNVIATSPIIVGGADDGANDEVDVTISVNDIALTVLADQADDTFLANISGGVAPPTAVALTTLAGAGLTGGADAILAVGAGTRITVNANDVQLATGAAESFLMNATAGVATADYRAGSSVAGAGLTYTAGGTLAVGAGTGITVNANDVAWNGSTTFVPDGDKGDITVSASGATWTVDAGITKSWTGAHDFTGAVAFTVAVSSDVSVASTTGGLWLSAGHTPVVSPSVSNGDVLINASNGAGLFALATPATNVGVGDVEIRADASVFIFTNGTERLQVESDGAWQLGGDTGTAGQVITSAGGSAPPTWGSAPVLLQVSSAFAADASITITPPTGTTWFEFEICAGGGGGGGADADTNLEVCAGAGGGGGEYARGIVTIVSGNITGSIGGGGGGGNTTGGNGSNGTDTVLTYNGVSYTCQGGRLGTGTAAGPVGGVADLNFTTPGLGGNNGVSPTTSIFFFAGGAGGPGLMFSAATNAQEFAMGGYGGGTFFGANLGSNAFLQAAGSIAGQSGNTIPGVGGSGAAKIVTGASTGEVGGAGSPGCMIVKFYSGTAPTRNAIT